MIAALALAAVLAAAPSKPVDDYLAQLDRYGFGATVLVADHGKPVIRSTTKLPLDTPYYVASVSKTFTAVAIATLARCHKLSLSDPITRFFANVPDDKKSITVEQLLRHTSGLPHEYSADAAMTRDAAVRAVLALKLLSPPGEKNSYSSDGYVLLAAIVEIASKQPFARYVTRKLLTPAGMRETQYAGACTPAFAKRVASGEQASNPCNLPPILARRGPAGVITTVDDMNRWIDAVIRRKLFGEHATIGWEETGPFIGHGGDDDAVGHSAMMFHDREHDRTLIVATNAGEFAGQPFASIVAHRLRAILQGDAPRTVTLDLACTPDRDARGRSWCRVEGQERIDAMSGPVPRGAEHNAKVSHLLDLLRENNQTEIATLLTPPQTRTLTGWWTRKSPRTARVMGTGPMWWDPQGVAATFVEIETTSGKERLRFQWNDDGTLRNFGGNGVLAPLVVFVREGEAFDPASGVRVESLIGQRSTDRVVSKKAPKRCVRLGERRILMPSNSGRRAES